MEDIFQAEKEAELNYLPKGLLSQILTAGITLRM
jgi:hypothetical protein